MPAVDTPFMHREQGDTIADDYYRLLHVQRDAPAVVIKASYRAIMQKLRCHPDLGGDEGNAKRLNEAMATLGDPARRAAYDRNLAASASSSASASAGPPAGTSTAGSAEASRSASHSTADSRPSSDASSRRADAPDFGTAHCRFCRASRLTAWTPAAGYASPPECARCGGPTRPVERLVARVGDKRQLDRLNHSKAATLWLDWPLDEPVRATLSDVTVTGCGLDADREASVGQVLLLNTPTLNAIAEVRSCRPADDNDKRYRIGLAFLTLQTLATPGDLYSAVA